MTRQEFISSKGAPKRLNDLMEDPVFREAWIIVQQEGKPNRPMHEKGDLIQQAAIAGAWSLGYFDALEKLRTLTIPPKEVSNAFDQQRTGQVEAAVERMMKEGGYTEEQARQAAQQFHLEQQSQQIQ